MWHRTFETLKAMRVPKHFGIQDHCFNKDWRFAEELLSEWKELYLSLAPRMAHSQVLKKIPLANLILETDAPYFGKKGKLGSPYDVMLVADEIAREQKISIRTVLEANKRNIGRLFLRSSTM